MLEPKTAARIARDDPAAGPRPGSGPDTRSRLLATAIELFARQGLDAVSLRAINTAAGARNASAAHYHFGSKLGLVEAIFEQVDAQIDPSVRVALDDIEARLDAGRPVSVREILEAAWTSGVETHLAALELARVERNAGNYDASRSATRRALAAATTHGERYMANEYLAGVIVEEPNAKSD